MRQLRTGWAAVLVLAALGWSGLALAADHVEVLTEVVYASDTGSSVDPALAHMKATFERSGINYRSYHRLSRDKVTLRPGQPVSLNLPNGRTATLTLKEIQAGSAQVNVAIPPVETTYTLGREGSVFIQAGPHNGGMLILVLSPAAR